MDLKELQKTEYEILKLFAEVCEAQNLRYYLTAGTLLGAVRHKGFIPWDDDIDVVMPRADYDRLCGLAQRVFPKEYFWQDENTEKFYPFPFAKLRKEGTLAIEERFDGRKMHQGVNIDIFPLDVRPDDDRLAERFFRIEKLLIHVLNLKADPDMECGYEKGSTRFLVRILTFFPYSAIKGLRRRIRILGSEKGSGKKLITTGGAHSCRQESYDAAWFENSENLIFEDGKYSCPCQWHQVLSNMYGDYMKPSGMDGSDKHFTYFTAENKPE